jgi:hypothetical protein
MSEKSANIATKIPKVSVEMLSVAITECIEDMVAQVDISTPSPQPLLELVELLRPAAGDDVRESIKRFQKLTELLEKKNSTCDHFRQLLAYAASLIHACSLLQ